MDTWGRFHQDFMKSFYTRRSPKCKNNIQVISHFALFKSALVKAESKHVGEINPWMLTTMLTALDSMSISVSASSFRSPPGLDNVNSDAEDNDNDLVGDASLESLSFPIVKFSRLIIMFTDNLVYIKSSWRWLDFIRVKFGLVMISMVISSYDVTAIVDR